MVRHVIRDIVKYGHWDAYIAAGKAWNEAGGKVGLPAYRLFSSDWGTLNEVFWEADFASSADIEARYKAAMKDETFKAASRAVAEHLTEGHSRDYVLSPVDLD
jgi:hypothetical protein